MNKYSIKDYMMCEEILDEYGRETFLLSMADGIVLKVVLNNLDDNIAEKLKIEEGFDESEEGFNAMMEVAEIYEK